MMLGNIAAQKINVNHRYVSSYLNHPKLSHYAEKLLDCDRRVNYNQFGTKTDALRLKEGRSLF